MRLESLTINKFRHVKPCTLEFADDLNVVLGKNGAGKTTLLKLIAAVCKLDFSGLKDELSYLDFSDKEDLSVDAVLRFAEWKIQVAIRIEKVASQNDPRWPQPPRVVTDARIALSEPGGSELWVELGSAHGKNSGGVPASDTSLPLFGQLLDTVLRIRQEESTKVTLPSSFPDLLEAWAKQALEVCRFDESLGFFDLITNNKTEGHVHAFVVIGTPIRRHLVPAELIPAWGVTVDEGGVPVRIALSTECALLQRWATFLTWETLSAAIELAGEKHGESTYASIGFLAETADRKVRHENFSYGQKRFLSFLYYAACQDHLLLIDELANGLHHEWIEICFAEMKGKQTIMSSQNPLIFDHLEFNDAAAVSKALILCSQNEQGEMVWENMHAESAAHFFTSYERGIRQVSEILREQKLW